MKNKIIVSVFVSCLISMVLSCSTDRLTPLETAIKTDSIPEVIKKDSVLINKGIETKTFEESALINVFKDLKVNTQKVTIKNFNDLPITTPKNTRIWILDYNLRTLDNKLVTYPFDVEITELLTIKDMLIYNKPTVSFTNLLVTGGAINIQVIKDGKALKVGQNPQIQLNPSLGLDTQMKLFYEEVDQQQRPTWQIADIPGGQNNEKNPEGLFFTDRENYTIFPSRFGWINVDKFYKYEGEKTKVKVTNKYPDIKSVLVFMLLPKINSVMRVYDGQSFDVPIGEEVHFIAVAKSTDGQFYSFFKEDTIKKDHVMVLSLSETTEAEFLSTLEKL